MRANVSVRGIVVCLFGEPAEFADFLSRLHDDRAVVGGDGAAAGGDAETQEAVRPDTDPEKRRLGVSELPGVAVRTEHAVPTVFDSEPQELQLGGAWRKGRVGHHGGGASLDVSVSTVASEGSSEAGDSTQVEPGLAAADLSTEQAVAAAVSVAAEGSVRFGEYSDGRRFAAEVPVAAPGKAECDPGLDAAAVTVAFLAPWTPMSLATSAEWCGACASGWDVDGLVGRSTSSHRHCGSSGAQAVGQSALGPGRADSRAGVPLAADSVGHGGEGLRSQRGGELVRVDDGVMPGTPARYAGDHEFFVGSTTHTPSVWSERCEWSDVACGATVGSDVSPCPPFPIAAAGQYADAVGQAGGGAPMCEAVEVSKVFGGEDGVPAGVALDADALDVDHVAVPSAPGAEVSDLFSPEPALQAGSPVDGDSLAVGQVTVPSTAGVEPAIGDDGLRDGLGSQVTVMSDTGDEVSGRFVWPPVVGDLDAFLRGQLQDMQYQGVEMDKVGSDIEIVIYARKTKGKWSRQRAGEIEACLRSQFQCPSSINILIFVTQKSMGS
jgi:hypothetical protein